MGFDSNVNAERHCTRGGTSYGAGKTKTHCGGNIADVILFPKCVLVLPSAQHLCPTQILCPGHKKCFWKSSETFLVSRRHAAMLPCFATDRQHRRTQCCRHNVSSFCQGLSYWVGVYRWHCETLTLFKRVIRKIWYPFQKFSFGFGTLFKIGIQISVECFEYYAMLRHMLNPYTPKSDQFQVSPAASPEVLHHTVWRTWLFIAYSAERWLYYQFSLSHLYISL